MATSVPNIPFYTAVLDQSGFISQEWGNWFRDLYKRTGAASALSNTELADAIVGTAIQSQIVALQASISLLQSTSVTQTLAINGLGQGRAL